MFKTETARSTLAGLTDTTTRALDLLIAGLGLVAVSPLMLAIAFAVKLSDGGPAFFRQERIGRDGIRFGCLKFRSMRVDAEVELARHLKADRAAYAEWKSDHKLRDDPRVTPFGQFLRVSSLDELPQLINILLGDMSLVGPRPIVPAEIVRYGDLFDVYCQVRPGLTGLWQVSGRSDVDYPSRVRLDVEYVQTRSVARYLETLVATIPAVLLRKGSR